MDYEDEDFEIEEDDTDTESLIDDAEVNEEEEAKNSAQNREVFERELATQDNIWGYGAKGLEAKKAAMTMLSTKTGMYARVPLICKADDCPYADTCQLLPYDLAPLGEYCPIETAQIEMRAHAYARDIDLDTASFTDRNLINEIIGYDIMLDRCRALMAKEGTPVIDLVVGINDGEEIKQPAVSKAWEAYEKIMKKRNEAYQLMMLTRRDNKDKADGGAASSLAQMLSEVTINDEGDKA